MSNRISCLERTAKLAAFALCTLILPNPANAGVTVSDSEIQTTLTETIRPFLENYCISCHSGEKPKGHFDLSVYTNTTAVVRDFSQWSLVAEKLTANEMPPEKAKAHPMDDARRRVIDWIGSVRRNEARKNAGDPGIVLARRLSNSEYNYTIRDLTGVDIKPAREFPVDPANPAGFDNSGESLAMSPALMNKYLLAAREVANHLVFKPTGLAFAPHPMLVETDRDKYCVNQIVDFYNRQNTNYADYFEAAWRYKHRVALANRRVSLTDIASESKISAKYLATIWRTLEEKEKVGPLAKLQTMWRELPVPKGNQPHLSREGCEKMREFVVTLRAKLEPRFMNLAAGKIGASSQPFLMWKNRQYAMHRMSYDRAALQIDGKISSGSDSTASEVGTESEFGPGRTRTVNNKPNDPDLFAPAGERARYEAAFAKFCAVFPDSFFVAERGRNYLDKTKDRGRFLSAGFHNVMGYFRDDQPLYELLLDVNQQKELDEYWRELDFVALGTTRTFTQFYLNESGEARGTSRESEGARPVDNEITSEPVVMKVREAYLTKVSASSNAIAVKAIEDHFRIVNDILRWVDTTKVECEPKHLAVLQDFAARAYRRPLSQAERDDLLAFYHSMRKETGESHEDAMRDAVVYMLMSPDFCYQIDLASQGTQTLIGNVRPLSDYAIASRLSYFLWSSMPDAELLSRAAKGDLHEPKVLAAQARRMLRDERTRALAIEFGGNWLDFRRFEELNTVDRERFPNFDNALREAMFEEPVRFMTDVFQRNRSVLDFLYANHTFVNPILAGHYGMTTVNGSANDWVRVADANRYDRGGVLPMAAFLTQNAPGLRTSPVKRGYWVVKRVLGENIPPPPAAVPELPRDEAKMELSLRDTLARHRQDPTCASCHARFDAMGLALEGYGPVGEKREKDLAGRTVDAHAAFPRGGEGEGFEGLRKYIREHRQDDFMENLCRKLLAYALGRSLILSDDLTIEEMRAKLVRDGYRFDSLIESIVTSPQFLNKRVGENLVMKGE